MKVIAAKPEHVFAWAELAKSFISEALTEYNWGMNEHDLHTTYHNWDTESWCFLLEHENEIVGCLAGIVSPHFFDYSNLFFSEFMWYIRPEHRSSGGGLMLYRALVRRCRDRNINRIVMGHTKYMADHFEKLYTKLGFTYIQSHYEKVL